MSLDRAVEILASRGHCGTSAWAVANNDLGPHAFGAHRDGRGQYIGINLAAGDAIRLAEEYEGKINV